MDVGSGRSPWASGVGHEVGLMKEAMSFEEKGQLAEAAKKYKAILERNKFCVLGLLGFKTIYLADPSAILPLEPAESSEFLLDQIAISLEKACEEEKSKAKNHLEEWANTSVIGQGRLARFIDCVEKDSKASSALLLKVNPGNPDVWFQLGAAYSFGDGVTQNFSQAGAWYMRASKEGHAASRNNLAIRYENGEGMAKDPEEAFKWYQMAATQGYADAQLRMYEFLKQGKGCEVDLPRGFSYLAKSANQGLCEAQFTLGMSYRRGDPEKNLDKAKLWLEKAAAQNDGEAYYELAVMYKNAEGVPQSWEKAVENYKKSANLGHVPAQNSLAVCYTTGSGTEVNLEEGFRWLRKAAEQGHIKASYNLGCAYLLGHGCKCDPPESFIWFEQAALGGHPAAMYETGVSYKDGRGTRKDKKEAKAWIKKAAEAGDERAIDLARAEGCSVM